MPSIEPVVSSTMVTSELPTPIVEVQVAETVLVSMPNNFITSRSTVVPAVPFTRLPLSVELDEKVVLRVPPCVPWSKFDVEIGCRLRLGGRIVAVGRNRAAPGERGGVAGGLQPVLDHVGAAHIHAAADHRGGEHHRPPPQAAGYSRAFVACETRRCRAIRPVFCKSIPFSRSNAWNEQRIEEAQLI